MTSLYARSRVLRSSKLSEDIATGNCLISGGIGVAPSWGSCAGSTGAIVQVPANSGVNTITPSAVNTIGLTVNGTSNATPDTAVSIVQGGAADALDVTSTGGNATNGINLIGTFTGELINSANFKVTSAGAVTAVGVNSGAGLLQGALGLTITGAAVSLNNSSNFNTSINTGTSTGNVHIDDGTGTGTIGIGNSAAGAIAIQSGSTINTNGSVPPATFNAATNATTR